MDSWEWNKIAGAVLGTLMFVLVVKIATTRSSKCRRPPSPAMWSKACPRPAPAAAAAPVAEALPDCGTVLPKADVAAGKEVSARCEQCHDLTKGGPNKIGPNLWGIVGRARATHPGFDYSSAMRRTTTWTYDELFEYLKSPAGMVPGTKMSFAGLPSAQDRINLIAYLRTHADTPAAIPAPRLQGAAPAAAAPAAAAPAAGSATPCSRRHDESAGRCCACRRFIGTRHRACRRGPRQTGCRARPAMPRSHQGWTEQHVLGSNLWDVVNRPRASHPGYDYSTAMAAKHDPWTYANLFTYLKQPQMMVPGTKMTFAGIPSDKDRTDLIGYLRTLSDKPAALPSK